MQKRNLNCGKRRNPYLYDGFILILGDDVMKLFDLLFLAIQHLVLLSQQIFVVRRITQVRRFLTLSTRMRQLHQTRVEVVT